MLTLNKILKVRRMMVQTGEEYRGFYYDHLGSERGPAIPANYVPKSGVRAVRLNLGYEFGDDGDLRIVNKKD